MEAKRWGQTSLGVSCTQDGLFLGRTALVERRGTVYAVRPQREVERLLLRAYGASGIVIERLVPRLGHVAAALGERNLCLAQIAALHLCLPDLCDPIARAALEAEDAVLKATREGQGLARSGWDPAEHPRAGVPPNPGWFAPTGDGSAGPPMEIAQYEEERSPEELSDPVAEIRQQLWDTTIARLREIDPQNPNLSYFTNPGAAPSQAALDRLSAALKDAAVKRVADKVMPGGRPIGLPGRSARVRELPGGYQFAKEMFVYLGKAGRVHRSSPGKTTIELPGQAGFVTIRQRSRSGGPAIDINVPGIPLKRIHFN